MASVTQQREKRTVASRLSCEWQDWE